eukprot:Skav202684  [mRNA]  locus=scaffold1791:728989:730624:+ [translate_table: standard]
MAAQESFDAAKGWVSELQGSGTDTLIALAGNKVDLEASRVVEKEARHGGPMAVRAYAEQMGVLFMETSAKSGHNVQDLFHEIAVRLPKRSEDRAAVRKMMRKRKDLALRGSSAACVDKSWALSGCWGF